MLKKIFLLSIPAIVVGLVLSAGTLFANSDVISFSGSPNALKILFSELSYGAATLYVQPYQVNTDEEGVVATSTEFFGDVTPVTNNAYDLGQYAKSWRNIYASGTIYGDGSGITGIVSSYANNDFYVIDQFQVGDGTSATSTLTANFIRHNADATNASGTLFVDSTGNIYASGTIYSFGDVSLIGDKQVTITGNGTFYTTGYGVYSANGGLFLRSNTSINIADNNTNNVLIATGGGKVGIGNGSPSNLLTVSGGDIMVGYGEATSTYSGGFMRLNESTTNTSGTLYLDSAGNVFASGTVLTADGTDSLPAFSFSADTDTGIYRNSANTIGLVTGGGIKGLLGTAMSWLVNNVSYTNNGYDLGGFENAWKNVYASGTIYADKIAADFKKDFVLTSPTANTEKWFTNSTSTMMIDYVSCFVDPLESGEMVVLDLFYSATLGGATTTILSQDIGCGNADSSSSTFTNATIPADAWWGFYVESVLGTVGDLSVGIKGHKQN